MLIRVTTEALNQKGAIMAYQAPSQPEGPPPPTPDQFQSPAPESSAPQTNEQIWQQSVAGQQPPQQPASPQTPEQPSSTAIRDAFADRFDPAAAQQFENDDQLLDALHMMYERGQSAPDAQTLQQFQQAQPILAEYAQNAADFKRWQQEQQAAQQPESPEAPKWQAPQLSDSAQRMLDLGIVGRTESGQLGEYDQVSGSYVQNPYHAAELREIEQFLAHQLQVQRRLATDPVGTLWEAGLEDRIKEQLPNLEEFEQKIIQKALAEVNRMANEGQIASTIEQQADLFFEKSDDGQFRTTMNPQTGQAEFVLSPLGQAYRQQQQVAINQFGFDRNDLPALHAFAMNALTPYLQSPQPAGSQQPTPGQSATQAAPPSTPQQQRAAKQKAFLDQARANGRSNNRLDQAPQTVSTAAARDSMPRTNEQVWELAREQTLASSG